MAKKSNPASAEPKKKNKKSKKSAPMAVAMKLKAPKDNPFETIWSRRKFDIIGKKQKGEKRRIGLSRSNAIEKRKSTLLKEYKQSGKSSVFVDKRIGEQNDELEEFDKAIMRSQRERQLKLKKKSKYNLSDGEEDELETEGLGSFFERDDFMDEIPPDDDYGIEEAENQRKSANFNQLDDYNAQISMDGEDQKHKSRKEIMNEVITKSKFFKAQKAQDKEEDEKLFQQLDKDFTLLMQTSGNALPAMPKMDLSKQRQLDPYDKIVKEMALEMRARPSDRTKTPEEIAQEERERLEQLEEERQKRMVATDDPTDEDNESLDDVPICSTEKFKSISGDDLGDSFVIDGESKTTKGWVDEILEQDAANELDHEDSGSFEDSENAEDDDDEEESDKYNNDDSEKIPSFKDWEQSDDENFSSDSEEDGDDDNDVSAGDEDEGEDKRMELEGGKKAKHNDALKKEKITNGKQQPSTQKESLPYLIETPNDFGELCRLLNNISNAEIVEAITRIRTTNSIKLMKENRRKMQVFYGLLLQYFAVLANKTPLNFELLNLLVKPLMEMSIEIPYYAAICARDRISRTRKQFCEDIKKPGKSCWPSLKTLLLLRLWSMIYPCSDFRHVVMTPALLLMCEYLMRCPVLCGRDMAIGSFVCSMVLSVVKQSQKYCPEAIMFLQKSLAAAMDREAESCQISQDSVNATSLDLFKLMGMQDDSPFFSSDGFRAGVLISVIETLRGFVDAYEEFKSFPEIFSPISTLLLEASAQKYMPAALQDKLIDVAQLINKKAQEHLTLRRPLQMRKQKPVPIKLLNPKFEESFVKGRDYDPDRERAEQRKLKKLIRREAKGAVRELRKDNYFLFEAKEEDKAVQEEERAEKYGKAMAFLQDQEHRYKSGQLGKGRKRRRR